MRTLAEDLLYLKNNHSLIGIKGGTEVEGMNFDEILIMKVISKDIIPMTVKIGGPEARNDIEYMLSIGIDKILAPMIESSYGLKNFVTTMEELDKKNKTQLAINIETITSYKNFDSILNHPKFQSIHQITVGRSDLSGSMEKGVDDEDVNTIAKEIVDSSKSLNKLTSCGGKINPHNSVYVKNKINPDCINTRNMVVNCNSKNISEDIKKALEWEKKFYFYLASKFPKREVFYLQRINAVESRLDQKKSSIISIKN